MNTIIFNRHSSLPTVRNRFISRAYSGVSPEHMVRHRDPIQSFSSPELSKTNPPILDISTHVQTGLASGRLTLEESMTLLTKMIEKKDTPDYKLIVTLLKSCRDEAELEHGRRIEQIIYDVGLRNNTFTLNNLLEMYARCRSIHDVERVYTSMRRDRVNDHTFRIVIDAFAAVGDTTRAARVFKSIPSPNDFHVFAMLHAYHQANLVDEAVQFFTKHRSNNQKLWAIVIQTLVKAKRMNQSVALLTEMASKGISPDSHLVVAVLGGCKEAVALQNGKSVEKIIDMVGLSQDKIVMNALLDMYGKCGRISEAERVFEKILERNRDDWTVCIMMNAYARNRDAEKAEALFRSTNSPGPLTILALLSAYSHAGAIDEAVQIFKTMESRYKITPNDKHKITIVDAYARANRLDEAEEFVKAHVPTNQVAWKTILGACRIHHDISRAERIAEVCLSFDERDASIYVLLSNIYAEAKRFKDVDRIRFRMAELGIKKIPGVCWIELNGTIISSYAGDHTQETRAMWDHVCKEITKGGYRPNHACVLRKCDSMDEELKQLGEHSEKISICHGLLLTPPGTPLLIAKNLRTCADCHSATKVISKVFNREITLRDASSFHHFKDGVCSCGDYY